MGILLLSVLATLQGIHLVYLEHGSSLIHEPIYRILLFSVAPCFYLFSRPLLRAQSRLSKSDTLHLIPIVSASFIPYSTALPLAFAMGAGYLLWLARSIYVLRAQRSRFQLELLGLGSVFLVALSVVVLGMSLPLLGETLFFQLYASAIGAAFILVSLVLAVKPQLASDVSEVSREAYAVSTLKNIDCDEMLTKLTILMENETLFEQADLSLDSMAKRLGLSSHQLSELINTRLGKSFSRYLREYRVGAAKQMLLEEPSASVLAVGLSVGFTSQSNFYDAFKEIAGMTPAKFRKINRESTQT